MSVADDYARNLEIPSDMQGHMPLLRELAAGPPGVKVIELGTRGGMSTSALLAGAESSKGHVWSIDISYAKVPDEWGDSGLWSFLQADALGGEALMWAPRRCNILFIDLDPHSYEQTGQALNLWLPRVVPGGVALLHDTEFPHVGGRPTPVHESEVGRAVDRFCKGAGLEWHNMPGSFGMGVIRLP